MAYANYEPRVFQAGTQFKHALDTTDLDQNQRRHCRSANETLDFCPQYPCHAEADGSEGGSNTLDYDDGSRGHVGAHVTFKNVTGLWIIPTCNPCNSAAGNVNSHNMNNMNSWVALRHDVVALRSDEE